MFDFVHYSRVFFRYEMIKSVLKLILKCWQINNYDQFQNNDRSFLSNTFKRKYNNFKSWLFFQNLFIFFHSDTFRSILSSCDCYNRKVLIKIFFSKPDQVHEFQFSNFHLSSAIQPKKLVSTSSKAGRSDVALWYNFRTHRLILDEFSRLSLKLLLTIHYNW